MHILYVYRLVNFTFLYDIIIARVTGVLINVSAHTCNLFAFNNTHQTRLNFEKIIIK